MQKKIIWITAHYFSQVDLPILPELNKKFKINWIVYLKKNSKYELYEAFAQKHQISLDFAYSLNTYNPLSILYLIKMLRKIKKMNGDIIYFDMVAFPYLAFIIPFFFKRERVILAMHHGKIHGGMRFKFIYKHYLKLICRLYTNFLFFSKSQSRYFPSNLKRKKVVVIPLPLNDFGKSAKPTPIDKIHFLSFGVIINTKNIELLIRAACKIYEEIGNKFHVTIAGNCSSWRANYAHLIKYPEIFTIRIERIPDTEIPDLFKSHHYLVLPYKAVSQSGPLRIAYSYNLPVITSNLCGFKESVIDGYTGLFFENDNQDSLEQKMKEVIENHDIIYPTLKHRQKKYIDENFSQEKIVEKYINLFNDIQLP